MQFQNLKLPQPQVFFEGTFFKTGNVDYVNLIRQWLLSGSKRKREKRAIHDSFGLTAAQSRDPQNLLPVPIRCMSEVPLETIALG